jgi:Zn-dependent M16 (insulinase) family peptidase
MELKNQRMLYPRSSAYRSETGGLMSALRVLKIEDIRKYHATYYAPHNMALVVCGPLERAALLDSLAPIEERLQAAGSTHGPQGPQGWKRPFVETQSNVAPVIDGAAETPGVDRPDPDQPVEKRRRRAFIEFPEKDESVGEVAVTWVGPQYHDFLTNEALSVLSTYLIDSAVSPVQQAFVERDDPLCTDIYMANEDKAGHTTLSAYFSSVPTEKLDTLDRELVTLLEKIRSEGIDMTRIALVLKRDRLKLLASLETKPADSFADAIIADMLYGRRDGADLEAALDDMTRFDQLSAWSAEQWAALLDKWLIGNSRNVVIGRPSRSLAAKLKAETKALEESRRKELGEKGLKRLDEELEKAKAENDRDIPPEMLNSFAVPSVDSIKWIEVGTAVNVPGGASKTSRAVAAINGSGGAPSALDRRVQEHVEKDGEPLPFAIQWDHVSSAFCTVTAIFSTAALPPHLRGHLNLYLSALFSLPITRPDGTKLGFEAVVKGLDEDTLGYETGLGVGNGFAEMLSVEIRVERENYGKAIAWLRGEC